MKKLIRYAACLIIPFSLLACKDAKKTTSDGDDKKEATAPADSHGAIGDEIVGVMDTVVTGMTGIKDAASADAFSATLKDTVPKLQALLDRAEALPAPTEEELADIRKKHDAAEAKAEKLQGEFMKNIQSSPPEAQQAIGQAMQQVMGGDVGKKMDAVTQAIDKLYKVGDFAEDADK